MAVSVRVLVAADQAKRSAEDRMKALKKAQEDADVARKMGRGKW